MVLTFLHIGFSLKYAICNTIVWIKNTGLDCTVLLSLMTIVRANNYKMIINCGPFISLVQYYSTYYGISILPYD